MRHILICICMVLLCACAGARKDFATRQELGYYKWSIATLREVVDDDEAILRDLCGVTDLFTNLPTPKFVRIKETNIKDSSGNPRILLGSYQNGVIEYSSYNVIVHETFHYISRYYNFSDTCYSELGARMVEKISRDRLQNLNKGRK